MPKARLVFDGDNVYIGKDGRIYGLKDDIATKIDGIPGVIDNLSSTSTTDALSANMGRDLQDQINAMSGIGTFLSTWDCTTGLPDTNPQQDPYTYKVGDYYIVSTVGATNYKPHGGTFTQGVPSTTVETENVGINDKYYFDGADWVRIPNTAIQITIDSALSTSSTNAVENRAIANAVNAKQDIISDLSTIRNGAAAGATAIQPNDNISQLVNNVGYQTAGDVATAIAGKQDILSAGDGISITSNTVTNTKPGPTISGTAPANPTEGMLWYDSTNDVLKVYDGSAWQEVGSDAADINTKTFYLSSSSDLTTAQAVYDWYIAGKNPIVIYDDKSYTLSTVTAGGITFESIEVLGDVISNEHTRIGRKTIVLSVTSGSVTSISTQGRTTIANVLATNQDYSSPYVPQYNGSPATKKYVDDSVDSVIPSGSTAPQNPQEGDLWYDTVNHVLKIYNGTSWETVDTDSDTTYTAGNGINISAQNEISIDTSVVATQSDIPTVNNATLTIQKNSTNVATFTANASSNVTADISVPTTVAELSDSGDYATKTYVDDAISAVVSGGATGTYIRAAQANGTKHIIDMGTDMTYTFGGMGYVLVKRYYGWACEINGVEMFKLIFDSGVYEWEYPSLFITMGQGDSVRLWRPGSGGGIDYEVVDYYNAHPVTEDYLCFTAEEANSTVKIIKNGSPNDVLLETSTDGNSWKSYTFGTDITLSNIGDKVYFRNHSETDTEFSLADTKYYKFVMTGTIAASGDVNYLLNKNSTTQLSNYCFKNLFNGCTSLTTAPSLPATTLANNCYDHMFLGCTSLTTAPNLPATTLASSCYSDMFYNCTSLTTAPNLPATTLANNCYEWMFNGCTSLTTAPSLPATTLANSCYHQMFRGCSSLTTAPSLPATALANDCYYGMFMDCVSLTTILGLPATTLALGCYYQMFRGCTSLAMLPSLAVESLANSCYYQMFYGCTNIMLSTTQEGEYQTEYRIPTSGTGTAGTNSMYQMFTSTGGTFKGTPSVNTTYYTSNNVI